MNKHIARADLEIKSAEEVGTDMIVRGIATTPGPDRTGDVVEPLGAKFSKEIPLFMYHDSKKQVGTARLGPANKNGIPFEAKIPNVIEDGVLRDRVNEARHSLKYKLLKTVSIGFIPLNDAIEQLKSGGLRWLKTEILELSLVPIPMNAEAEISYIKSFDEQQRQTASGRLSSDQLQSSNYSKPIPALREKTLPPVNKGNSMTNREHIAALEAKRAANAAAMQAIADATQAKGESMDADQSEQFDTMDSEIGRIDEDLARYRKLEKMNVQTAKAVPSDAGTDESKGSKARAGDFVMKQNQNLPKGIGLARYAKALCWSRITMQDPIMYAKQWDDSTPEVSLALKTAVAAGTTTDTTWASPLVYANNLTSEFVDFLRPKTIIGKLDGLRRVPFNVRYPIQNGGSTVAWVGQGAPKPVSKLSFTSATLGFAKAAGIVVITQELARFSAPGAELVIRDDMAAQMVYFLDQQFIDPGVAAVANVSPASILNGAANVRTAAGLWTSMANVLTDVYALMTVYATNEISLDGAYWVMTPDTALRLSILQNVGGTAPAFPQITINGGSFMGIPVIVTNALPHSVSAGAIVALIKPSEIFLADDGGINITVSGEASLNMDTAPTNNSATPTATSVVSMFQTDSIAIRAERFINWGLRRTYGVGYIDNMHTTTNP